MLPPAKGWAVAAAWPSAAHCRLPTTLPDHPPTTLSQSHLDHPPNPPPPNCNHPPTLQIYWDGLLVASALTGKTKPLQAGGALMLGAEQDCYGGCTDRWGCPARLTLERLHAQGAVLPRWRSVLRAGDASACRHLPTHLACCHLCHLCHLAATLAATAATCSTVAGARGTTV